MRGATLFLQAVRRHGISKVFGIVGGEAQALRFDEVDDLDFYLTRHEFAAGIMADVYARLTGHPQMCYSTFGPGLTNLATGVCSATLDRSPMLAVSAQVPRAERRFNQTHQCIDNAAVIRPMAKFAHELESVDEIPDVVTHALQIARSDVPGPSFISFPLDLMQAEIDDADAFRRLDRMANTDPSAPAEADPSELAWLTRTLAAAKRPMALAGNAVIRGGAGTALRELLERYQLPLVTTLASKGVLPADHPLYVGACNKYLDGILAHPVLDSLFAECDLMLLIGYDFGEDVKPGQWKRNDKLQTISLTASPNPMGSVFAPDKEIVGNLRGALTKLLELASAPPPPLDLRHESLQQLRTLKRRAIESSPESPPDATAIVAAVRDALGRDGILCSDIGLHKQYAGLFSDTFAPNTFLCSNGCGTFGFGLPAGMAAKLAHPERRVAVVCGDGGFHSTSQDLETAARYRLPIVVVLLKDNAFGLIKYYQLTKHEDVFGDSVDFGAVDFVKLAEANGVIGRKVDSLTTLREQLEQAFGEGKPVLLEVPVKYQYQFDAPTA